MSDEITNFMGSVFLELESMIKMKQLNYNQRFNKDSELLNNKLKDMSQFQCRSLELSILTEVQNDIDDWIKECLSQLKKLDK